MNLDSALNKRMDYIFSDFNFFPYMAIYTHPGFKNLATNAYWMYKVIIEELGGSL